MNLVSQFVDKSSGSPVKPIKNTNVSISPTPGRPVVLPSLSMVARHLIYQSNNESLLILITLSLICHTSYLECYYINISERLCGRKNHQLSILLLLLIGFFSISLEKSVEHGFVENLGVADNNSCIFCIQHILVGNGLSPFQE